MVRQTMILLLAVVGCGGAEARGDGGSTGTTSSTPPTMTGAQSTGSGSAGSSSEASGSASATTMAVTEGASETGEGTTGTDSSGETGTPLPPVQLCSGAVVESLAVAYADDDPERNLVDLYVPEEGGPCPLLLWVHGGAWLGGSRALGGEIEERLTRQRDRGFAIASIDYRLSTDAIFPAQIYDVKAALRWIRANAETYGIDPHRIAVMGSSAGGHLVALAGTSSEVADLEDLEQGNASERSDVQAVIDCYGPTTFDLMDEQLADNGCGPGAQTHSGPMSPESRLLGCAGGLTSCPEDVSRADPITYVDDADPPFLIGHGAMDCTVPPGQSVALDEALQAANVPTALHVADDSGHAAPSCPPDDEIDAFLDAAFGI